MLAKKYQDFSTRLTYPLYVQPKLNGVRCIQNRGDFQSRDAKFWNDGILSHLLPDLVNVPETIITDGELYKHGVPLQSINGAISVNRIGKNEATTTIQYHIFDCVLADNLSAPFSERTEILFSLLNNNQTCVYVETHLVYSPAEADHYYDHYLSLGYEGMMYRTNSEYGLVDNCSNKENRWACLLKRKDWLDEDCEIVDVAFGEGKYSDCVGSLQLRFPNGPLFWAGSGLSDIQRMLYMDVPPIGRTAKIKYEMLSVDGSPLKPTILAVLD